MFGTGLDASIVIVLIVLAVAVGFTGVHFIKCAWCGKLTGQRDRSALGDSAGICPECASKIRGKKR